MKPSKIKSVKGKKAWFLLPNFKSLTWMGTAYCAKSKDVELLNKTDEIDSQLKSHETIHVRQAESTHNSWFLFYLRYVWQWILNIPLVFSDFYAPYKFMQFELEAYLNQDDWDYCQHGGVTQWKKFEKIKLKTKREWAWEYYHTFPKPYFTRFLREKIKGTIYLLTQNNIK
jgi:hypothetical protein